MIEIPDRFQLVNARRETIMNSLSFALSFAYDVSRESDMFPSRFVSSVFISQVTSLEFFHVAIGTNVSFLKEKTMNLE